MIPIYVCDDDEWFAMRMKEIIRAQTVIYALDMGPVYVCGSPQTLLDEIRQEKERAIYFLDVNFPGFENGFELAAKIRKSDPRGFIIFITAHGHLAMETFRYRLEAMDYIVKESGAVLNERIQSCLRSIEQRVRDEPCENGYYYSLKILDEVRHIPVNKILYFKAIGRNHQICLHMEDEMIDFYGSLQNLQEDLGEKFWRCHRGLLVNVYRVSRIFIKAGEIELDNRERCAISRRARLDIPRELRAKL